MKLLQELLVYSCKVSGDRLPPFRGDKDCDLELRGTQPLEVNYRSTSL
jgi:hypothetical protein